MIFVYRPGHFGDALVSLPAVLAVKERHPDEPATLITNQPKRGSRVTVWDVLRHTGCFQKVLFYRPGSFLSLAALWWEVLLSGRRSAMYYLSPCRSRRQILRDQVFFRALCGFGEIRGLAAAGKALSIADRAGRLESLERESDRLLRVVSPRGSRPQPPLLFPGDAEQETAERLLEQVPSGRKLVALGSGAKMESKIWPPERYNAVCRRLLAGDPRLFFLLLGDSGEFPLGESIRAGIDADSLNLAGRTTIMESAAVLARCVLYLGNDTGAMHLAAVMGVPTVAIFSARDNPGKWEPYGDANTVIRKQVDCEGCMLTSCGAQKQKCLTAISVDEVYDAAVSRLRPT